MRARASQIAPDAALFTTHKEMLSADLCDAYVIVTPNDTHHQILLDILPAGKPILCEKPLCTTITHCNDVIKAAKAPVWVAMEYRYMDPLQELKKALPRIGAGQMISIRDQNERYDGQKPDIIDNAYVIVDFENGARGMLDLCMFSEGAEWQETVTVTACRG